MVETQTMNPWDRTDLNQEDLRYLETVEILLTIAAEISSADNGTRPTSLDDQQHHLERTRVKALTKYQLMTQTVSALAVQRPLETTQHSMEMLAVSNEIPDDEQEIFWFLLEEDYEALMMRIHEAVFADMVADCEVKSEPLFWACLQQFFLIQIEKLQKAELKFIGISDFSFEMQIEFTKFIMDYIDNPAALIKRLQR